MLTGNQKNPKVQKMDRKPQTQQQKQQISSSPLPNPPSCSSLLRDISNVKTPKPRFQSQTNPSFNFESPCPRFFTALKNTPKSSSSTARARPRHSLAAQKLKAVELEQSKSARKARTDKEKSLKSLAKSLTVWLNFLFENPRSCGVEVSRFTGEDSFDGSPVVTLGRKRDSVSHDGVGVDREWRGPKRRKDMLWVHKGEVEHKFSSSMYSRLQVSLEDVCSLDDMNERMSVYLNLSSCKEIFDVMTHLTKNIDEGRLKMKAHCPIVTDVGMKENALKILMCYNPVWLRIGIYIIFGGESLLPQPDADMNAEQEVTFLKMVAKKLLFSHSKLAKAYVYNKRVDGLYRPGYYEKLGSVILKKFLLLALILDRAKSQSSLPISYGIDGLDGGSPLLFTSRSSVRSSSEMIYDFLSPDIMHGVGNLLTHLTIIGYKVSYQQNPLVQYVFEVTDLFNDLQDGVLLCRVVQLLQHDPSILKKVIVPSDDRKKNMANCEIALRYLKQIGVPLCDEDGTEIITADIVDGDKELVISLLWNMFVHLQVPLLINNKLLADEITTIRGPGATHPDTSIQLEMLLEWIKAICENYELKVENFTSLVDGKAMWCLLDYYFRKEQRNASSSKDAMETNGGSIMSASDYVDAVHNFLLSQKMTTLLGNFPEVLQVSDILEYKGACSDRGVIILLVFLSSQLIVKRNLQQINFHKLLCHDQSSERKCIRRERLLENNKGLNIEETCLNVSEGNGRNFKAIMAWWKEMAQHHGDTNVKPVFASLQSVTGKHSSDDRKDDAAKMIQSHYRRLVEHQNYTRMKKAVSFLQTAIRVWLMVKNTSSIIEFSTIKMQVPLSDGTERISRYLVDRHAFVKLTHSVVSIQRFIRSWISRRHRTNAAIFIQTCYRSWISRRSFLNHKKAATKIQSHYIGWIMRKSFLNQKQATIKVQSHYRGQILRKSFLNQKQAAIIIQRYHRGWLLRNNFLKMKQAAMQIQSSYWSLKCLRSFEHYKHEIKSAVTIQSYTRGWMARRVACRQRHNIMLIQSFCRGCLVRREFLLQKEAITRIQSAFRRFKCYKAFRCYMNAAIVIQQFARGCVTRKRLLEVELYGGKADSHLQEITKIDCDHDTSKDCSDSNELEMYAHSVSKLQKWWRGILLSKRTKSAIIIQSYVRGRIARRITEQRRHRIAVIQSYWKGYIERKHSRGKLSDIRLRVQKSAANVDDGMRIINRLIAALLELKNLKSVSGILHTCATLDMATKHSQKCCEKLVAAGAIKTLLDIIRSISRSIADQEVLRLTLSTFRNLTRHSHLTEVLINTPRSGETLLWEFIRNKEDTYFIAADVLRNICSTKEGVKRLRTSHALVKRLHNLVEDLKRKAHNEKRNLRSLAKKEQTDRRLKEAKEQTDRRLKEAVHILKLIRNG